jgi:hypothetical protein
VSTDTDLGNYLIQSGLCGLYGGRQTRRYSHDALELRGPKVRGLRMRLLPVVGRYGPTAHFYILGLGLHAGAAEAEQ